MNRYTCEVSSCWALLWGAWCQRHCFRQVWSSLPHCWICLLHCSRRVHAVLLCLAAPAHTVPEMLLRLWPCAWDSWLSCSQRIIRYVRHWFMDFLAVSTERTPGYGPQALYGDAGETRFPSVSFLIMWILCAQMACLVSGGLDCHILLSSDEVGHSPCNFLSYLFSCLFLSFISRWKFWYPTARFL